MIRSLKSYSSSLQRGLSSKGRSGKIQKELAILNTRSSSAISGSKRQFSDNPSTTNGTNESKVSLQLDYYMSPQFAGIACAMTHHLYETNGIHHLDFLPICPVGLEMERVRSHHNQQHLQSTGETAAAAAAAASNVTVGSVEQNIFIPTLHANPELNVKAIAAMFRKSPLCLASIDKKNSSSSSSSASRIVGAHEDTVSLLEGILDNGQTSVVASPRETKITDLLSGKVDAIQAYKTTEVPTLERHLDSSSSTSSLIVEPLEGMNGAKLGYSQVLFAPQQDLLQPNKREILQSFLKATFSGWEIAIRDPETAAKSVEEVKKMIQLDDEQNDHWGDNSLDYSIQSTGLCCDYVKETFEGDRYGVINKERWNEATTWLLPKSNNHNDDTAAEKKKKEEDNFGLDADVWQPSSQLLAGNELARSTLEEAASKAAEFKEKFGRKPSLIVITLGELSRYTHGKRRLQIYSNDENSWFNKTLTGESNGFHVVELNLPQSTTEDELLSHLYDAANKFDGIQLMWPLPPHIDPSKMYNTISRDRDVDGVHYVSELELLPSTTKNYVDSIPPPPVTPLAVIELLKKYDIDVKNKEVLVIGRSRIVGSPLSHMLRNASAIVTVAHSEISSDKLEQLVRSAEIVISCAGSPGLLSTKWIQPETTVINVGTTFSGDKDALESDFDGNLSAVAKQFSPVPGGVGPLSAACLFKNTVTAATKRMEQSGDVEKTWEKRSGSLNRSIHFKSYDDALAFANKVNDMSSELDHHANMTFSHKCVNGVNLELEFFTYEANEVTTKDYIAAQQVNDIIESDKIKMNDYTYDLKIDSIAKYPADPRGSSRLLRVNTDGVVTHYDNFSESFHSLAEGAHIVFNESKVANARVSVSHKTFGKGIELMILDLGDTVNEKCNGQQLTVMLRHEGVEVGEIFSDEKNEGKFRVVKVNGPWIEDKKSNGNGTECVVECIVDNDEITLCKFLDKVGTVPIPPYLSRDAELSDDSAYNNVYAAGSGSVAAPTAGLHFTDSLLAKIGSENMSFLSLHVGAGTFKPVVTEDAQDHSMHGESFSVSVSELNRIIESLKSGKRLIVVGTTSSRTLESLYWCGIKKLEAEQYGTGFEEVDTGSMMTLGQNEWKHLNKRGKHYSSVEALEALTKDKVDDGMINGRTSLMIVPGAYSFKVVDELVTNFHDPNSTLMLLVSSFLGSGEKVKTIYEEAQRLGYRFLSYGDVCFFSKKRE